MFDSYNRLVAKGSITRTVAGLDEEICCRPCTAADMQGAKASFGMASSSHSVWCHCQRGDSHLLFPDESFDTYEAMLQFIEQKVGCSMKTYEEMCSWAHYSPGVAKGGGYTRFKCSCCGYSPTEKKWRADLAAWHLLSDEEQEQRQHEHRDQGDELRQQQQHFHQLLFQPPLPHHGMERAGVDNLHLTYLNFFKHLFKYTIHEGLPETARRRPCGSTSRMQASTPTTLPPRSRTP